MDLSQLSLDQLKDINPGYFGTMTPAEFADWRSFRLGYDALGRVGSSARAGDRSPDRRVERLSSVLSSTAAVPVAAQGLSTSHNVTQALKIAPTGVRDWGSTLQLWPSGSVGRVVMDSSYRRSVDDWSPYEPAERRKLTGEQWSGGKRGEIKGYSKDSRRRLLRECGKLDRGYLPVLCTLTFSDDAWATTTPEDWKRRHLRNFYMRLKRKYPGMAALWRLELVDRKSGDYVGEYAPHFHLILWLGLERGDTLTREELEEFRRWLDAAWQHGLNRTEVIRSARGTAAYIGKYVAKEDSEEILEAYPDGVGRVWGRWQPNNLPESEMVEIQLTAEEGFAVMRHFKRLVWGDVRDDLGMPSLYAFLDDPVSILDRLDELIQHELSLCDRRYLPGSIQLDFYFPH